MGKKRLPLILATVFILIFLVVAALYPTASTTVDTFDALLADETGTRTVHVTVKGFLPDRWTGKVRGPIQVKDGNGKEYCYGSFKDVETDPGTGLKSCLLARVETATDDTHTYGMIFFDSARKNYVILDDYQEILAADDSFAALAREKWTCLRPARQSNFVDFHTGGGSGRPLFAAKGAGPPKQRHKRWVLAAHPSQIIDKLSKIN